MSYELSFSEEFFVAPHESLYCDTPIEVNSKGQPVSLFSAIRLLISKPSKARARLCSAYRCKASELDPMTIMDRAREIDTCDSIGRNGVPVYITPFDSGWGLTVTVYEQDRDCEVANG